MKTEAPEQIYPASRVLRAINHRRRWRMVEVLQEKEMNVTQLSKKLNVEHSLASQHLAVLLEAKAVLSRRQGKFIYYSANNEDLDEILALCRGLSQFHQPKTKTI